MSFRRQPPTVAPDLPHRSNYHHYSCCMTADELATFIDVDAGIIKTMVRAHPSRYYYHTGEWCRHDKSIRVLSADVVGRLLTELHELTGAPLDRISLLLWMVGVQPMLTSEDRKCRDAQPFYDAKLEKEISRIAKLSEPARTIQAVELLRRYRDAETIAGGVLRREMGGKVGVLVRKEMAKGRKLKMIGRLARIAGMAKVGKVQRAKRKANSE